MEIKVNINNNDYPRLLFTVLANDTALKIMEILKNEGEKFLGGLAEMLNITDAQVSHLARQLTKVGLVKFEYRPASHGVRKYLTLACKQVVVEL